MIQQEKAELEKLHREAELKKAKALESKARIEAAAAQKEVLHFNVIAIDLLQFVVYYIVVDSLIIPELIRDSIHIRLYIY